MRIIPGFVLSIYFSFIAFAATGWTETDNGWVFYNEDGTVKLRYSVKIPSKAKYDIDKNHIKIEGDLYFVQIINYPMSGKSMAEIATTAEKWYNEWVKQVPGNRRL